MVLILYQKLLGMKSMTSHTIESGTLLFDSKFVKHDINLLIYRLILYLKVCVKNLSFSIIIFITSLYQLFLWYNEI